MKQRIQIFDSLRGIACLIVLLAHILASDAVYGAYASGCGKIGVWLFMVMSGFLSFFPFLSDAHTYKPKWILGYYKNKFIKLYPAFCIALLFALIIGFISDFKTFGMSLIFGIGVGHFWYMPVIVQFYFLFPIFVLIFLVIKRNRYSFISFLLCVGGLISYFFPFVSYKENSIMLLWYLPVFIMGMILCFGYHWALEKIKPNIWFDIIATVMVVCIILFTPLCRKLIWHIEPSGWLQNKYLLIGGLWSICIFGLLFSKKLRYILERIKFLKWLGTISYEVYLIHYVVLWKLLPMIQNTIIRGILVILLSIGISCLLHYGLQYVFNKQYRSLRNQQAEIAATDEEKENCR